MNKKILYYIINTIFISSLVFTINARQIETKKELLLKKMYYWTLSNDLKEKKIAYTYIKEKVPLDLAKKLILKFADQPSREIEIKILDALKLYPVKKLVPFWLEELKKKNSHALNLKIIKILGNSEDRRIVKPLAKKLDNPIGDIRKETILALKKIGDDRVFPTIFKLANDKKAIFRVYALEALFYLYDLRMYSIIEKMIYDESKSIRILTLRCIEKNKINKILPRIRSIAVKDDNWEVRINALNVLGNLSDNKALYALLKNLENQQNREIRYAAANNLLKLKFKNSAYSVSVQLLKEKDNKIKNLLLDLLIELRDIGSLNAVKKIFLTDESINLRIKAAHTLSFHKSTTTGYILVKGLEDSDYRVKAEICNSLGLIRKKKFSNYLIDQIKIKQERYVRTAALYSLLKMRDYKIKKQLKKILKTEDDFVFEKLMKRSLRN